MTKATGLIFPTDSLRESGREFLTGIGKQVEDNTELEKLIESLEKRHDSYMEDNAVPSPLMDADGEVPSADMIGSELENFLAKRHTGVAESTED